MKLHAYTIFDVASGIYMRPFFSQADGQAIRGFKDIALDKDHEIGKHPEDYTLFRIGDFNDNTGEIRSDLIEKLINGSEVLAEARQVNQEQIKQMEQEINGQTQTN